MKRFNRPAVHIAILVITVFIFYAHTFDDGFMFDDYIHYQMIKLYKDSQRGMNIFYKDGQRGINIFDFVGSPEEVSYYTQLTAVPWWTSPKFRIRYFRPVATLSHLIEHSLWEGNAFLYHVQSVLWYAALVIALYWFYRAISASSAMAFVGALIFALEPCHYLNVRWIASRNDLICATFLVVSFISYLRFCKSRIPVYGILFTLFYVVALLSKEISFLFPILVITYDWTRYQRFVEMLRHQWKVYLSLCIINMLYLIFYTTYNYGNYWYDRLSLKVYLIELLKSISLYLMSLFYNVVIAGLSPHVFSEHWRIITLFVLLLLYLLFLLWRQRGHYPEIVFFLVWMLLPLLFIVLPPIHDRVLLIPSIGYSYLAALAIYKLGKKKLKLFFIFTGILCPLVINVVQPREYDAAINSNYSQLCRAIEEIVVHKTSRDRLFFINFPKVGLAGENYLYFNLFFAFYYHYPQWKVPVYLLSTFDDRIAIKVIDKHHIRIDHPTRFYFETNTEKFFSLGRTFSQGETFTLPEVKITIDEVNEEKVKSIVAEFSKPIDDPYYYFLFFDEGRWQRWNPREEENPFSKG